MTIRSLILTGLLLIPHFSWSAYRINLESGLRWQGYNDVRIPPQGGDTLDLDRGDSGVDFHFRTELFVPLSERQNIRFVYAPLSVVGRQVFEQDVSFVNATFVANQVTETQYKFNSYRVSYLYDVIQGSSDTLQLGVTLKARDARITLNQGLQSQSYTDFGFVPLLYVAYQKSFGESWILRADLDGAVAPQGRAIDFSVKLNHRVLEKSQVGLGYRALEGGAKNDKVYTFSGFHYLVVDFSTEL